MVPLLHLLLRLKSWAGKDGVRDYEKGRRSDLEFKEKGATLTWLMEAGGSVRKPPRTRCRSGSGGQRVCRRALNKEGGVR